MANLLQHARIIVAVFFSIFYLIPAQSERIELMMLLRSFVAIALTLQWTPAAAIAVLRFGCSQLVVERLDP